MDENLSLRTSLYYDSINVDDIGGGLYESSRSRISSASVTGGNGRPGGGGVVGDEHSSGIGSSGHILTESREPSCSDFEKRFRPKRFLIGQRVSNRGLDCASLNSLDSIQLRMLREKCHTMEKKCNQKLNEQRLKYDQMFDELSSDLELLTNQLMTVPQQTQDMYQEGQHFEESVRDLENQNDLLQETIHSYEKQLSNAENEMKVISVELETMRRELSELRFEVQTKDATIEELRREKIESEERLDIQKKVCKCQEIREDSKDILSIQLQEMHHLLSQKSAETVRNSVALRWKTLEISRIQQLSDEEKKRLHEELTNLTKNLSETNTKVLYLEKQINVKETELTKMTQRLMDSNRKESDLHDELLRKTEQISSLEKEGYKLKSMVEDLSADLDKTRLDGRERETQYVNDLTRTREKSDSLNTRLIKAEETLKNKSLDNESLTSKNEVLLTECKKLKEENFRLRGEVAALEGRCESLNDLLKNNKFEMTAIQQEINRLSTLDTEVGEIRENNRIFIRQNRDVLTNYQEIQKQHSLLKEQYRVLLESKEQLQLSLETSKIWQKEYQEREVIVNTTLVKQNEHIKSLLEERKTLIVKINDMQNDLIITTNTLDQYREKLGTTTNEYGEYEDPTNYDNAGYDETENQQSQMIRYNSDPQLNQTETQFTYLTKVQEVAKKFYRTCREWPEMIRRQIKDDVYTF